MNIQEIAHNHLKGISEADAEKLLPEGIVLLGYRGSIAHNCYVPNTDPNSIDDKDIMGVFIPPIENYFGLSTKEHHEVFIGPWDAVSYELRKFVKLLINANPNVLSLLWLQPQHYICKDDVGDALIENRDLFVSTKIYHSFTGYAHAQLSRMTRFDHNGYMGEKRKRLVEKFGFDVKNASHLIRLLRMGIEFLNEGQLHVFREDAPQLLEIKRGEWTLEKVKEEAEALFKRAEAAYDRCTLPHSLDVAKIEKMMVRWLEEHFRAQNRLDSDQ